MNADFSINLEGFLRSPLCGAILPNPNAPTGMAYSRRDLEEFIGRFPADRVIIIDEAYISFGAETVAPLIDRFPNLLVVRTLSKDLSLAGLRLGYALGQKPLIDALGAVKNSFNSYPVDTLASNIAILSLEDRDYYAGLSRKIQAAREKFVQALEKKGWETLPSRANFVFTRKKGFSGEEIYRQLRDKGFLVRFFNLPGIEDFVRITIGTDDQMDSLEQAMEDLEPRTRTQEKP
jgi:histidinol-phosphate aminotransferase